MKTNLLVSLVTLLLCQLCSCDLIVPNLPPEPWKAALMARYIIHNSDWVSIATTSTQDSIKDYPYVGLKSLSDGPKNKSTGWPYLYMTDMDVSGHDLQTNKKVSIMATLAQSDYCRTENYDPQDPRCAKVIITGEFIKINKSSSEYLFGQKSLFERHPAMADWPSGHEFYVSKINPLQIDVLDYFGGMKHVSKEDYFNKNITNLINADVQFNSVSIISIDTDNGVIMV